AEGQLAVLGPLPRALDVVEYPRDLRPREVGRERQADVRPQTVDALVARELAHQRAGAGVLPDDRVVDRLAGLAVPHDRRLALVGDADRGDVAGLAVGRRHRTADDLARAPPHLLRVVLDPTGARCDLLVLAL